MSIVFWSGGKDAYLALNYYMESNPDEPVLLTTYNKNSGIIPFQDISLETIKNQAAQLGLPLKTVGLPPRASNEEYISGIAKAINGEQHSNLIFGDWHLEDIRIWREQELGSNGLGYTCHFPLWEKPFGELLAYLETLPAECYINSVDTLSENYISIGEKYDQSFVDRLPNHIDPMGENGEFHTVVRFS